MKTETGLVRGRARRAAWLEEPVQAWHSHNYTLRD